MSTYLAAGLSGFEEPVKQTQQPSAPSFVSVEKWGVEDVCAWVTSLGLQQYQEVFRQQAIDGTELLALTAKDLEESMGIGELVFCQYTLHLVGYRMSFAGNYLIKI